jgi:hypothetical protein
MSCVSKFIVTYEDVLFTVIFFLLLPPPPLLLLLLLLLPPPPLLLLLLLLLFNTLLSVGNLILGYFLASTTVQYAG